MDAPKDDKFEYAMAYKLNKLNDKEKILILDDIQLINMIDFWRSISPLNLTQLLSDIFLHWCCRYKQWFEFVVYDK